MERFEANIDNVKEIKNIMSDIKDDIFDTINIRLGNDKPALEKRSLFVKKAIDGNLSLDTDAFEYVIKELIKLHSTPTSKTPIKTINDITSKENYGDFITFIEDEKKHYIIGDLHADLNSFLQILKSIKFQEEFDKIRLVFLGDYIDRGKDRVELINRLILLKFLLPDNIYLLKGNHELYIKDEDDNFVSPMMNADSSYFFNFLTILSTDEQYKQYGVSKEYIQLFADFFDSLPIAALFNFDNIKICAVHGGLPRVDLNSEDYYGSKKYESFNLLLDKTTKDCIGISQQTNMLWSDPYDGYNEGFRDSSDIRFAFSKNQFIAFCKLYDIYLVLRAHEQQRNGYRSYFDDRLISVFSSGGRNMEDDDIANDHSYYSSVSPNILSIQKQSILSMNINFTEDAGRQIEKNFLYNKIKRVRTKHQTKYVSYSPLDKKNVKFNEIDPDDGILYIVDGYNQSNKRIIQIKEKILEITAWNLQQFYGIHKDFHIKINTESKTITNLSDIFISVDLSDIPLQKNQEVVVGKNNFILSVEKCGLLNIVF